MSHQTARESYRKLSERLNRFPQGAPPTELLFQILELLFSPEEAELVSLLPIKPFNVKTAAHVWRNCSPGINSGTRKIRLTKTSISDRRSQVQELGFGRTSLWSLNSSKWAKRASSGRVRY